jgi:hypothetical protein
MTAAAVVGEISEDEERRGDLRWAGTGAFAILRSAHESDNAKLIDLAAAVIDVHCPATTAAVSFLCPDVHPRAHGASDPSRCKSRIVESGEATV